MAKPKWTCGTCTLLNPASKRRCQVCNSRRPVPAVENPKVRPAGNDAAKRIPRFEMSSTETIRIHVTTCCGGNGKRREMLAESLVVAARSIADSCKDDKSATKIGSEATKSRKRARQSTSQIQRKRPLSPSVSSRDSMHNNHIDNNEDVRIVNTNIENEKRRREKNVDTTSVASSTARENDVSKSDVTTTKRQSAKKIRVNTENSGTNCSDSNVVVGSIGDNLESKNVKNIHEELTGELRADTDEKDIADDRSDIQSCNPQHNDQVDDDLSIHARITEQTIEIDDTEPRQQKLNALAATQIVAAIGVNDENRQADNCSSTKLLPSSDHRSSNVETSITETSTNQLVTSPVKIGTKDPEKILERQPYETKDEIKIDNPCVQRPEKTPTKNNDREENLSQVRSEESQSSFLNCRPSGFAYTPPGMPSQASQNESPEESEDITIAMARFKASSPGEQHQKYQHQECEYDSVKDEASSSLPSSSYSPRLQESDGLIPDTAAAKSTSTDIITHVLELTKKTERVDDIRERHEAIIEPASRSTLSTTKSFTGMFQTAGSGAAIEVSEEKKVKEMATILDTSSSSIKEPTLLARNDPFTGMFQTAGSGSSIEVSEEKVTEMATILNRPSLSAKEPTLPKVTVKRTFTGMFQTAGSGSSIEVSEEKVKEMEKILDRPSSSTKEPTLPRASNNAFTGMFQTAGSGAAIAVSEEKVKEMAKILDRPSSSTKEPTLPRANNNAFTGMFQTAGSGTAIAVSEEKVKEMGKILDRPPTSTKAPFLPASSKNSFTGMFQTAGSGAAIEVSEDKVKEVAKILDRPSISSNETILPRASKKAFTGMFQTAGSGTAIAVSEDKVKEMGNILDRPSSSTNESVLPPASNKAFAGMFQTAGSDSAIEVSQEQVKEMGKRLNRPSSFTKGPTLPPITSNFFTGMFQTAGSGSSIAVSEAKVKEVAMILDRPSSSTKEPNLTPTSHTPFTGMFQTAGSGSSITVSEEKVKEMGKMLDRPSSSTKESFAPDKRKSPTLVEKIAIATKLNRTDSIMQGMMPTRTPLASFRTPRSVTVAKNDSAMSSAKFRTAGIGKSIHVSEEAIEEAETLLKKASSFNNQLSEEEDRRSQKCAKVTVLAEKKHRQRSLANRDHVVFDANIRSYPHSPLRTKDSKLLNHSVVYTPFQENDQMPNEKIVVGSTHKCLAYGVTPSTVPNVDNATPLLGAKDEMVQLKTILDDEAPRANAVDTPLQERDTHCSPTEFKLQSQSANISVSDLLIRKRQVGNSFQMTPVPIHFHGKMDTSDATVMQIESNPNECETLEDAIRHGFMTCCPSTCRLHGVREVAMLINCNNSLQLRFDLDGRPRAFEMNEEAHRSDHLGSLLDIRKSLIDKGCDPTRLNDTWIRNHTRWIVWKLASYERRFSRFLAGRYLTYQKLIQSLVFRFRREVLNGVRPAVRKIVNRDISASNAIILLVCGILSASKAKADDASFKTTVLELSDGWYSVKGCLDSNLSQFVADGLITVGTKLLVSNARLVGAEDGVDPLDEGDGTNCESCKATLQLTANATRLANWNAKLGFVNPLNKQRMPHGRLLIKRISDVVPGGGNIPAIRLFIQRVYSMLYYEKSTHSDLSSNDSMLNGKRRVFTEQEEDTRRREFESRKLRVVEKLRERIQQEVEQEIDQGAPEIWKRMVNSTAPEDTFESLSVDERSTVSKWKEKRNSLINRRVREEVESELEIETSLVRESTSFLRVKVHSIDPKRSCNESAMLTIWQPTEEQLGFLKEGTTVEIHNLAVRESAFDGILQLVANSRTIIEASTFEVSSLADKIGFRHRRFLNLFHVHKLSLGASSKKGGTRMNETFDVAAVQIHVQTSNIPEDFTFYLSDETNLLLRVHCRDPPPALKTFLSTEKQSFPQYAIRDLLIRPFDHERQCSVAEFSDISSLVLKNHRVEALSKWVASSSQGEIHQIATYIKSGLPLWEQSCDTKIYLGYVIRVRNKGIENFYIEVDCCGQGSFEWKVSVDVLGQMIPVISSDIDKENIFNDAKNSALKDSLLSSLFRSRGILWRFKLLTEPEIVVCSATEAEKQNIGQLYKSLQRDS